MHHDHEQHDTEATQPREFWRYPERQVGHTVQVYDETASTNDLAKLLAWRIRPGTALLTRQQTAGRGQYGRVWHGGRDLSVLLSVIVEPPPALRRPVVMTAWSTVAVARAIHDLSGRIPRLKWPNDLLIDGKKLSGILIESLSKSQSASWIIAGIGLNVRQTAADFQAAGLPDATSLEQLGCKAEPDEAAERVLFHLNELYESLLSTGGPAIEAAWSELLGLRYAPALIELRDGYQDIGIIESLQFTGIRIMTSAGSIVREPESIVRILSDSIAPLA